MPQEVANLSGELKLEWSAVSAGHQEEARGWLYMQGYGKASSQYHDMPSNPFQIVISEKTS